MLERYVDIAVSTVQAVEGGGQLFPVVLPGFRWKLMTSTAAAVALIGFGQGS